jgi:hypothetical protein
VKLGVPVVRIHSQPQVGAFDKAVKLFITVTKFGSLTIKRGKEKFSSFLWYGSLSFFSE